MLREALEPIAQQYGMDWNLRDTTQKRRVVLMVSKFDHCLGDLLYRADRRTADGRGGDPATIPRKRCRSR
jgi:formyltetrahydrofolate hydrolase